VSTKGNGTSLHLRADDGESAPRISEPKDDGRGLHAGGGSVSHDSDPAPAVADALQGRGSPPTEPKWRTDAVGWRDLPRKKQLVVITLARLSEPLVQTSLQVRHLCPGAMNME
jgi:hypothetical protein